MRSVTDRVGRTILGLVAVGLLVVLLVPAIQTTVMRWLVTGIGVAALWVLVIELWFPVSVSDVVGWLLRRNTDDRDR